MALRPGNPRPHVVSHRPNLQRLRHRESETEAGTHVELPELRTRHDRNLRAAINLRNLIMPAGRSRDGPGQEAMGQQGRWLRAKVIAVLLRHKKSRPCRGERERDPGAGTKAGVPGVEAGSLKADRSDQPEGSVLNWMMPIGEWGGNHPN